MNYAVKIDIINWNEESCYVNRERIKPAKVISVIADGEEKRKRLLFRIISCHLLSVKKDRMQDLLQD